MASTPFQLVGEFHSAFGHPVRKVPTTLTSDELALRLRILLEEVREVVEAAYGVGNGSAHLHVTDVLVALKKAANYVATIGKWGPDKFPTDFANLAKELSDLEYVTVGFSHVAGLPHDDIFQEVHRSNMSKAGPDGRPIYDEGGKILKGPNYSPANVEKILKEKAGWEK